MSEIDRAELRRLLDEAPPLPWRYREHGYPGEGPSSVALEAKPFKGGWEPVAVGDYDQWSGYGVALAAAAVNALPDLLDALEKAEGHRDSLAATLIEVQREKLALERAIDEVRELHRPMDIDALQYACAHEDCEHEFDCPTIEMTVCRSCYILGQLIDVYDYGRGGIEHVSYPCPTIQALDGK